ncbi:MAG: glycosyltransferase family 2 protein [Egibacteraceae bacterium]
MSRRQLTVIICTRDRPRIVLNTLDALARQRERNFAVLVIDQSASADAEVARRIAGEGWTLLADAGHGLARARNIGWKQADTDWVVYVDDDVLPQPGWAAGVTAAIAGHPEASALMGHTPAVNAQDGDYLTISEFPIEEEQVLGGRWLRPWLIGFGLNQGFRRSVLRDLGGFDERLGAGAADFPSADDMDMNYRFLRAGGLAVLAPAAAAAHDQWRTSADLAPQYGRYMRGWTGFAMKHLRKGDVLGGMWLWQIGLRDVIRMFASALRRRSRLRLRVALHKARGLAEGTWVGLRYPW